MLKKLFKRIERQKQLETMDTILMMLMFFSDMIHELKPDHIDVKTKYELVDMPTPSGKGFGFSVGSAAEVPYAMEIMKDSGYNVGVDDYHDRLCKSLKQMIIMMKPDVSQDLDKLIESVFSEIKEGINAKQKVKR